MKQVYTGDELRDRGLTVFVHAKGRTWAPLLGIVKIEYAETEPTIAEVTVEVRAGGGRAVLDLEGKHPVTATFNTVVMVAAITPVAVAPAESLKDRATERE